MMIVSCVNLMALESNIEPSGHSVSRVTYLRYMNAAYVNHRVSLLIKYTSRVSQSDVDHCFATLDSVDDPAIIKTGCSFTATPRAIYKAATGNRDSISAEEPWFPLETPSLSHPSREKALKDNTSSTH